MNNQLIITPIGGVGDVTKNMYLYEFGNELLIVDCGVGFPDQTMIGVDLLLPDVSYLLKILKQGKKISGMVLTHGHEDHIGALPFILPQIPQKFPIFASPLTAAFANEKLKEFGTKDRVTTVNFNSSSRQAGPFKFTFIRVTHSVPDTSHIFIETPAGNFYHGSDFKLDETPYDKNTSDINKIRELSQKGVQCLMSDCLGAERKGRTLSEIDLIKSFENEIKNCVGKFIVTTYSSNIARLNQVIEVSQKYNRKVCFVGRSLIKAKDIAKDLGYLHINPGVEVKVEQLRNFKDRDLTLIIAGSQGQEESAMARVANGEHRDIKLNSNDLVIFSADPIPGNETFVYELVDTITKKGIRVLYSSVSSAFHVSGHGSQEELSELIKLVRPKKLIPIGGNFRHMFAYKNMAMDLGYKSSDILLLEDGREVIFQNGNVKLGKTISLKNVYVDEVSGEELENFVLRDRQKLSSAGVVIILAQVSSANGQFVQNPDIIIRGFNLPDGKLSQKIITDLRSAFAKNKKRVTNWHYIKKVIGDVAERRIFREFRNQPLVLPVVIEV